LYKNYQTNQRENLGQCWDHESQLLDAVLWRVLYSRPEVPRPRPASIST